MKGQAVVVPGLILVLLTGCGSSPPSASGGEPTTAGYGSGETARLPAERSDQGEFALLVHVARKAPSGERIGGARVRLLGSDLEAKTDPQGAARPFVMKLTNRESFPHDIEVSKPGYKTCVIKFGSMVFPRTGLWRFDQANPAHLFVYLPDGQGVAGGDECYGGRTQPQTPGPVK